MTVLLSLYPRAWRERYEDEFIALLEARPPDVHDRIDIVRGAIDARLHPRADVGGSLEPPDPLPYNGPWTPRRVGYLTLVGGIVFLATVWLAINGPVMSDNGRTYHDGSAAWPTLFISLMLLLLGAWAVAATVPRTSRLARTATVIAAIAGLLWACAPWLLYCALIMFLGLVILAIEAARTGRWRSTDAALVVASIVASLAFAAAALSGFEPPIGEAEVQYAVFALLAPVWFATAHALLRPARPIADPISLSSVGR
jgi:hypothetical protein